MAKVQRTCQQRGQEFWVRESWLAWDATRGQFCSDECAKQNQKQTSERIAICLECGKEFTTQQGALNRGQGKYCSQSCAASFNNMQRPSPIDKEYLIELYLHRNYSMAEIAKQLRCSTNKVVYWMDQYGIERRDQSEATYVKRNPDGDPFKIQEFETQAQQSLFDLGIGLYIGEGTKSDQNVCLANSDPSVIRIWLRFLREICNVEETKLFAYLNMFDDLDVEQTIAYWQDVTCLARSQFFKPTIRSNKGEGYGKKSPYGTLTVGISNKKLARQMTEWCSKALVG